LFERLRLFLDDVRGAFPGIAVIIDGSFVMGCVDEPDDIDLLLIVPSEVELEGDFKPHEYNVISRNRVRHNYRFDCRAVTLGSLDEAKWVEFYSQVNVKWRERFGWPSGLKKGIVRLLI
jgi:hypothetical protein